MNKKFSPDTQTEINDILNNIQNWNNFFNSKIEFYFDGWAIFLREKFTYPRVITIFKSYNTSTYSIKSFEVTLKNLQTEEHKEIYSNEDIKSKSDLLKELKDIIYGKDLIQEASKLYNNMFSD